MRNCIVLPTAGSDPENPWLPDAMARARARISASLLHDDPDSVLAIIGGYKNHYDVSLAERLATFFIKEYPLHTDRIDFIDGRTNNTVDDLAGLFNDGPAFDHYLFTSNPAHCRRIEQYQNKVPLCLIEVRSEPDEGGMIEAILQMYARVDPFWTLPVTGNVLRMLTNHRANQHRQMCQRWKEENEAVDFTFFVEHQEAMLRLQCAYVLS